jgi:hypothetical protein
MNIDLLNQNSNYPILDNRDNFLCLINGFEDFMVSNGSNLEQYYKNIVYEFYKAIQQNKKEGVKVNFNKSVFSLFSHDILAHQLYNHSFSALGDLTVYESRNLIFDSKKYRKSINQRSIIAKWSKKPEESYRYYTNLNPNIKNDLIFINLMEFLSSLFTTCFNNINIGSSYKVFKSLYNTYHKKYISEEYESKIDQIAIDLIIELNKRSCGVFFRFKMINYYLKAIVDNNFDKQKMNKFANEEIFKEIQIDILYQNNKQKFLDSESVSKQLGFTISNFRRWRSKNEHLLLQILTSKEYKIHVAKRFKKYNLDVTVLEQTKNPD